MATFVFNIAKGRVAELYNRVDSNDPAASAIVVVPFNSTATQATLEDLTTLAAIEADALTAEALNVGGGRKVLTDTDLAALTPDNTNNRMPCDTPDQVWTGVAAAGGAWTHLLFAYDSDTAAGTDANIIPMTWHDFAVTPNGGNITAQVADFFRAT